MIFAGCLHADDPGFRRKLWDQCVNDVLQPNTYFIGLGDYRNLVRTTYRKHIRGYNADDNSQEDIDTQIRKNMHDFYRDHFQKIAEAKKIITLLPGNHLWEFNDGTNDTQYLCQLAKATYGDRPTWIRLKVTAQGKTYGVLKILCHHGDWSGGSGRAGGDVTAAENKALGHEADIYAFSHTHRLWAMHIPTITIPERGELKPIERSRVFVRSGCFVAGYDEKCVKGYAQQKLLNPTALGYPTIEVKYERHYSPERAKRNRERSGGAYAKGYDNARPKFTVKY